jgi:putative addiction module killer protein
MAPDAVDVREHLTAEGESPFGPWFADLNPQAAAKVTIALIRIGQDNLTNVKGVGAGVFEYKLDFEPGYRLYFGKDGQTIVILLAGGNEETPTA